MSTSKPTTTPTLDFYEKERGRVQGQYETDLAALNAARNRQLQQAAINDELLRKYLPQMNQMSGLSGLGVSESANIDALSRYQNNVTSIDQGYQQSKSELDRYRAADIASINAAERTEQREDRREKYGSAQEWIMSGAIDSQESLDQYLTSMGYTKGTTEYNELSAYAAPFIADEEDNESETVAPGKVKGEQVRISYPSQNGKPGGLFLLKLGGETTNEDVIGKAEKLNDGDVFLHDNTMYIKKNGDVYEITDENGKRMSDSYSAAFAYFSKNETPENDFFKPVPKTDLTLSRINNGVVYYKGADGVEKSVKKLLTIPKYMQTDDLTQYKYNENTIFESAGHYYLWQNKNLYELII